jgi:hypothetical protein
VETTACRYIRFGNDHIDAAQTVALGVARTGLSTAFKAVLASRPIV